MKLVNRIMSALGYVPAPAKPLVVTCMISVAPGVDRASLKAAIAKLTRLQRAAEEERAKINAAAALQDFGDHDLCAEPGRDLVLAEVRAQREQIAKVVKMLESQQRAIARSVYVDHASGLPG